MKRFNDTSDIMTLTEEMRSYVKEVGIVSNSKIMHLIFLRVQAIAASRQPVLVTGETGTGKELLAHLVHRVSKVQGQLVAVNAAGLDDTMFSDCLFGHEKGAFTGAYQLRGGLLEQAADGTLFLDEVGELSTPSQVKLLRLLQDGTYYPLGADRPGRSRARVIVATNVNIEQSVKGGAFREDLYYRLRVHHLHIPPLRERQKDLWPLMRHFAEHAARKLCKHTPTLTQELYCLLKSHTFPGNVRELQSMIFDAVAQHQGSVLSLNTFRPIVCNQYDDTIDGPRVGATPENPFSFLLSLLPHPLPTLTEAKLALVTEAMNRAKNIQGVAAGMLGLRRETLNKYLSRQKTKR